MYVMSMLKKLKEARTKFLGFCLGFLFVLIYMSRFGIVKSLIGDLWEQEALMESS